MNIKNAGILILVMVVQILCLGVYTQYVLKDVVIASIKTETSKVINTSNNDLKTKIDNNFKKINELNSNVTTALPIDTHQENTAQTQSENTDTTCIPIGYSLVNDRRLSRRILREKRKKGINIFH